MHRDLLGSQLFVSHLGLCVRGCCRPGAQSLSVQHPNVGELTPQAIAASRRAGPTGPWRAGSCRRWHVLLLCNVQPRSRLPGRALRGVEHQDAQPLEPQPHLHSWSRGHGTGGQRGAPSRLSFANRPLLHSWQAPAAQLWVVAPSNTLGGASAGQPDPQLRERLWAGQPSAVCLTPPVPAQHPASRPAHRV